MSKSLEEQYNSKASQEYSRIGSKIAKYRKRLNMTQEQFAEIAGISSIYLSEVERGVKLPRLPKLLLIFSALGIEPNELFSDDFLNLIEPTLTPEFRTAIKQAQYASKEKQELITLLINMALTSDVVLP